MGERDILRAVLEADLGATIHFAQVRDDQRTCCDHTKRSAAVIPKVVLQQLQVLRLSLLGPHRRLKQSTYS